MIICAVPALPAACCAHSRSSDTKQLSALANGLWLQAAGSRELCQIGGCGLKIQVACIWILTLCPQAGRVWPVRRLRLLISGL